MGVSSVFSYIMTFLSTVTILCMLVGIWSYYTQPGGQGRELLPEATVMLLNDYFPYILVVSLIVVIGEWTYKRPKKRKYEGEEYLSGEGRGISPPP